MSFSLNPKKIIIAVVILLIAAAVSFHFIYWNGTRRGIRFIPPPVQTESTGGTKWEVDGNILNFSFLYEYDIEALVVHTCDYDGSDLGDKISPRDFALAWGVVAEYNDKIDFHWKQANRGTYFTKDEEVYSVIGSDKVIDSHLSNNHIIPADDEVYKNVRLVRRGDHIRMKGYLVNVDGTKGNARSFTWHTSNTREDTGDHACEVVYVTSIEWL